MLSGPDRPPADPAGPALDLGGRLASLVLSVAAHRPVEDGPGPATAGRDRAATPVTLLTGFLGAGKSTVLAALLANPGAGRVVRAVVNDVGRLRFDPTIVDVDDRARVELTNGCGCCAAVAATELGARLDEMADGADLVVLEASGLADPAALAQVIEARPGLTIDRTVAVVDARSVDRLLALEAAAPILSRQLATAEAVVLSHADGLSAAVTAAVSDRIAVLAAGCPIVPSTLDDPAHRVLAPGFPVGANPSPAERGTTAPLVTASFDPAVSVAEAAFVAAVERGGAGLLRGKGRLLIDGRSTLVQLTPSGLSLAPADAGPIGLTIVATDHEALAGLVGLFGLDEPAGPRSY